MLDYQDRLGFPPTLEEIRARFGYTSKNGVKYNLEVMAERGYVVKREEQSTRRYEAVTR